MAQSGFEIEKLIVIDVPASELWEMIGPGFVEVYKWSSNVDHAVGSGKSEFEGAVCSKRSSLFLCKPDFANHGVKALQTFGTTILLSMARLEGVFVS